MIKTVSSVLIMMRVLEKTTCEVYPKFSLINSASKRRIALRKKTIFILPAVILMFFVSCNSTDNSYYPLKENLEWNYLVSNNSSIIGEEGSLKMTVTNMPKREMNGKTVTPQKVTVNGIILFNFYVEDQSGIYSIAQQTFNSPEPVITKPDYLLHFPIEIGSTYEEKGKTQALTTNIPIKVLFKVESNKETVTVPAGTFENCLKIRGVGDSIQNHGILGKAKIHAEYLFWYAPGIGLIKAVITEKSNHLMSGGGSLTTQLESFKK